MIFLRLWIAFYLMCTTISLSLRLGFFGGGWESSASEIGINIAAIFFALISHVGIEMGLRWTFWSSKILSALRALGTIGNSSLFLGFVATIMPTGPFPWVPAFGLRWFYFGPFCIFMLGGEIFFFLKLSKVQKREN
jgi:hypothetical protein